LVGWFCGLMGDCVTGLICYKLDGWFDVWLVGLKVDWVDGRLDGFVIKWMGGWMAGGMFGWVIGFMVDWIDE